MAMGTVDVVFVTVCNSITFLGKMWWILMVLLRLLVLLSFTLFRGEEDGFVCNTIQPGCASVCLDVFAPLSLFRFLWFQLLILSLPHLVFLTYVVHRALSSHRPSCCVGVKVQTGSVHALQRHSAQAPPPSHAPPSAWAGPGLRCAYFLDVLPRMLLEAAFVSAQFYLYGFAVPRRFLCDEAPCVSGVACYVAGATEKTLLLNYMLAVASLSFLLTFADFACSLKTMARKREVLEEEQSSELMGNGVPEDTEVLLTRTAPNEAYEKGVNAAGGVPSDPNGVPVRPHRGGEAAVDSAASAPARGRGLGDAEAVPRPPVLHGRYVSHSTPLRPPPSPRSARGAAPPKPSLFAASDGAGRRGCRYSPTFLNMNMGRDPLDRQSDSSESGKRSVRSVPSVPSVPSERSNGREYV